MTRDDIIRMALEAGLLIPSFRIGGGLALGTCTVPDFERFASLVVAADRADCAAVCKDEAKRLAESANRLDQRGSTDEAGPVRALAWKCNALKERIEDRGKQ